MQKVSEINNKAIKKVMCGRKSSEYFWIFCSFNYVLKREILKENRINFFFNFFVQNSKKKYLTLWGRNAHRWADTKKLFLF